MFAASFHIQSVGLFLFFLHPISCDFHLDVFAFHSSSSLSFYRNRNHLDWNFIHASQLIDWKEALRNFHLPSLTHPRSLNPRLFHNLIRHIIGQSFSFRIHSRSVGRGAYITPHSHHHHRTIAIKHAQTHTHNAHTRAGRAHTTINRGACWDWIQSWCCLLVGYVCHLRSIFFLLHHESEKRENFTLNSICGIPRN